MEFKDNIKQLKKQYFDAIKLMYNKLIKLKMISNRIMYYNLNETSSGFSICMLNRFSDKTIVKLVNTNIGKAIEYMRMRGVACIYTAMAINLLLENCDLMGKGNTTSTAKLRSVMEQMFSLGEQSILNSNTLAKKNNIPLFNNGEFNIEDYKHY